MSFAEPTWLLALAVIVPALVLVYVASERRMQTRLRTFAASKLAARLSASYSPARQRLKMGLALFSILLLGLALARPQYGVVLEESEARGIDLMIALDTSRSMLAEDVKPSRLERAKLAVLDLVNAMRGDRVGLVAFAGDAFLQCPLTLDYDAFRATLEATDTHIIARGGTDIASAIDEARKALGDDRNFKLLVLITDGEDLEASGLAAAREAAEAGLRIFTVGVGSGDGEPIPVRDAADNLSFLRDASGKIVQSRLDEDTLQAIAAASNGAYTPLGATGGGLQKVYEQLVSELPAEELGTRMQEIPLERYQWPLIAALALLFLEPLLGTRSRRVNAPLSSSVSLLLLFLFLVPSLPASPLKAMKLYENGQYKEAAKLLEQAIAETPDDARLHYNLGNAYYRLEDWTQARREFEKALETTDPELQADAFFNLGNTLFQQGEQAPDSIEGRKTQLARWEEALRAYENSAALRATSPDLKQNEGVLERAIAAISRQLNFHIDPLDAGEAGPAGRYVAGSDVEIEATANDGWMFRKWQQATVEDATQAKTTLTLNDNTEAIAHFVKTWHLDVLSKDETLGTAEKTGEYPEDQPAPITATAKDKYVFKRWEAEGAEVQPLDQPQAQVTLTQDAKVTAFFVPGFYLEVLPEPTLGGFPAQTGWYEKFTDVPISAEAREGFEWIGWVGKDIAEPMSAQTTVTMNGDRQLTANFERKWNLIVAENDRQGGTVTGSGDFPLGTTTPITAKPNEGYKFVRWEGPKVTDPTAAETTVTVASTKHDVIAIFEQDDSQKNDQDQNQDQNNQQNQDQQDQDKQNQDQPNQDQQGDSKDQNSEQQENQDQQAGDSGTHDQQDPDKGEKDESDSEPSQEEESGEEQNEQSQPQPGEASEAQEGEAQPGQQRVEGQMTKEEARQFLNALRESEKKLPAVRKVRPGDDTTGRDW